MSIKDFENVRCGRFEITWDKDFGGYIIHDKLCHKTFERIDNNELRLLGHMIEFIEKM
jgi:hypothetical protein